MPARLKIWPHIGPVAFTADGTSYGIATITTTIGFYIGQQVSITADTLPNKDLQVKQIISSTQLLVGPQNTNWTQYSAINFYTVALNAKIEAAEQQYTIDAENGDIIPAVYENFPIGALRNILVDRQGNFYSPDNPLPIAFDGTIEIGEVKVVGENGNTLEPNADGSVKTIQLLTRPYSGGTETYPTLTQEVIITTSTGGTVPVERVTINYTDSTKNKLDNFQREYWDGFLWILD